MINDKRYSDMIYNRCGKSGLKLPAVSLGLWHNFGTESDSQNRRDLLTTAFNNGITHFDLANNYGPVPGSAEENFGKVLHSDLKGYRDELIISTKAGYLMWDGPYGEWGSRKYLTASLDQSLKRMNLDYVDIFYSHRFDPETPLEETMGALASAVSQGKALYVGISNYDAEQTRRASEIMKAEGIPLLIHQARYHMLNRTIEEKLLPTAKDEGMGVICFCPLAQGLLTSKYLNSIPKDSRAAGKSVFLKPEQITEELVTSLNQLNQIASQRGQTLAQMALSWVLRNEEVTSVLIGASRAKQIIENVKAADKSQFGLEELIEINKILDQMPFIR